MIDHQLGVGVTGRQLPDLLQAPPAHQVDRQGMPRRGGQHPIEAGGGRDGVLQDHLYTDRAFGRRPVGDRIGDAGIVRVDRLDQPEPAGMSRINPEREAGVIAENRKG